MSTTTKYSLEHTYDGYVVYMASRGLATDVYLDSDEVLDIVNRLNSGADHDDYDWREWRPQDCLG